MHLSAPIFSLKRKAKLMARKEGTALHATLDRVAIGEGFLSWSHLASEANKASPAQRILSALQRGDVLLLGARPGHGKTLLGLELAARATEWERTGFFFTLDDTTKDVDRRFADMEIHSKTAARVEIDTSDDISASYIIDRLADHAGDTLAVIDYLQLLDQKRSHPSLDRQMHMLASFAKSSGAVIVVISQIDRSFDLSDKTFPGLSDIRLPNPLNTNCLDATCFLHEGQIRLERVRRG